MPCRRVRSTVEIERGVGRKGVRFLKVKRIGMVETRVAVY